jgi:hypothetical protein
VYFQSVCWNGGPLPLSVSPFFFPYFQYTSREKECDKTPVHGKGV